MKLRYLHLSDLHLTGHETSSEKWAVAQFEQDMVNMSMLRAVKEQLELGGPVDLIIITGDLARSGKLEEYRIVDVFCQKLLELTELPSSRLFFVPGNHDVDRGQIEKKHIKWFYDFKSQEDVMEVLYSADVFPILMRKFTAFNDFAARTMERSLYTEGAYFLVETLSIIKDDTRIHVNLAGLNSALFAGYDGDDKGKLALGLPQVEKAIEKFDNTALLNIVFFHHPPICLSPIDKVCVNMLMQKSDLILTGHLHEPANVFMRSSAGEAILIGAGASYEKRESENSFNIVDIDLFTGLGHVQFYKYLSAMNRWIKNRDVNPDDESGAFSFEIQKIRQSSLVSHPETADIEVPKSEDTNFFEDAYEILRRERRPLHYDDISRKLMTMDDNGSDKERADAIHRALLREIEKSESAARKPLVIRVAPGVFMANPSSLVYEFEGQVNKPTGYYRRFPSIGQAYFPFNSNLSIPDGWTVFVKTSDHILVGFGSGIHQLSVQNLKIPPKSYQWSDEYGVGFQGYIQFVRSNTFTVNWGTPQPILVEDPKLGIMPIRGFGDARMQISNIELFLKETVASDTLRIEEMIRTILIQSFSIIVYENLKSFGDLALIYKTSDKMQGLVALEVVKFGIEIKGITIGHVGVHDDFLLQVRQIKKKPVQKSRKEKNDVRTARKKPVAKNPKMGR